MRIISQHKRSDDAKKAVATKVEETLKPVIKDPTTELRKEGIESTVKTEEKPQENKEIQTWTLSETKPTPQNKQETIENIIQTPTTTLEETIEETPQQNKPADAQLAEFYNQQQKSGGPIIYTAAGEQKAQTLDEFYQQSTGRQEQKSGNTSLDTFYQHATGRKQDNEQREKNRVLAADTLAHNENADKALYVR